jgi:hypothetical protein
MKARIAALALLLHATTAAAVPQGAWPDDARNLPLGRPAWILVVPASRADDGSIRLWDRQDEWLRSWVVPKATPEGIRTVAITGDSEDQKLVHGEQLDDMRIDSLRLLARKYSADAVAVVVRDSAEDVAVAAWRVGAHATWEEAVPGESGMSRDAALSVIDALFSDVETKPPEPTEQAEESAYASGVKVVAERISEDGIRMEYRIECPPEKLADIQASSSLEVTRSGDGTVDVLVLDGREISDILKEIGLGREPEGARQ